MKPVVGSETMAAQLVMRAAKAELTMRGRLSCGVQPCVITKAFPQNNEQLRLCCRLSFSLERI